MARAYNIHIVEWKEIRENGAPRLREEDANLVCKCDTHTCTFPSFGFMWLRNGLNKMYKNDVESWYSETRNA